MIYYLKKQEVKIGEKCDLHGVVVILTQQIVYDNPELFEVKSDDIQYFECIKKLYNNSDPIVGEIYKATNADCNGQSAIHGICMVGSDSFHACFKPSTKEAYEKQELIKEAKLRYPIGARIIIMKGSQKGTISCNNSEVIGKGFWFKNNEILSGNSSTNYTIYEDGKWAEIVKPLFQTEDGVDFYEGSTVHAVCIVDHNDCMSGKFHAKFKYSSWKLDVKPYDSWIYFSTEETAKAWIEENKPKEKTLEDYEDLLLNAKGSEMINGHFAYNARFYQHLKHREPKLYYTKVLQLIADDLNGDWTSETKNSGFFMYFDGDSYDVKEHKSVKYDIIYFESNKLAYKAIEIIGDKLDYIFK